MGADDAMIARLAEWLDRARSAVVFTGAGISTESGIPDFRSPGGIWTKYQPIDFQDFVASAEMRRESWRRKIKHDSVMGAAEPNAGHRAVAELVERGSVAAVVTQNVDGLHQASGVPADRVIELHGNATYAKCLDCGKRFELGPICEAFERDETLPICDECGAMIKTATISFGQAMPEAEMRRAEDVTLACDLFLAMGSSLVVYPAAAFPAAAKRSGARLVIVNREETEQDAIADLVIHGEIGETMTRALRLLGMRDY